MTYTNYTSISYPPPNPLDTCGVDDVVAKAVEECVAKMVMATLRSDYHTATELVRRAEHYARSKGWAVGVSGPVFDHEVTIGVYVK